MTRVVYAFPAYNADFDDALENVKTGAQYFDYVVVIEDSSELHAFTEDQRKQLLNLGAPPVPGVQANVVLKQFPFEDDHPKMYQHGVDAAHELEADWYAFSDCDEHFNEAFLKDVHKICNALDKQGIDMAGVKCHAQFSIAEGVWPSSLSVDVANRPEGWMDLEKWPEKVVETNDHKLMLMKCYPGLTWVGVGRTKTVHTSWINAVDGKIVNWKAANLPDQYWYLHRKTPLQVFSSAARNMFISGGGANLGDVNTMWVELRELLKTGVDLEKPITTWSKFENYVQLTTKPHITFGYPPKLVDWIKRALTWKATDYGTETRQCALWMIYYNKELLDDPAIKDGIEHPAQLTEEDQVERYVQEQYVNIMGRWPDKVGLDNYKYKIISGQIDRKDLPEILKKSDEYKEKRRLLEKDAPEHVKVQFPVDSVVNITEDMVVSILMHSETYGKKVKRRADVGKFVEEQLGEDFYKEFYELKGAGKLDAVSFLALFGERVN